MKRLRNAATGALLMLGSVLLFFLLLEIALRVMGYPHRDARFLCLDPIIHNVYCPGIEAVRDNGFTPPIPVKINSQGMADEEYPFEKPPGTLRVALLGDSVTASIYTPIGEKFEHLWERDLARALGRPVEFLNLGLDGTGTWEQIQLLHLRGAQYHPDFVVLVLFWGNDLWNNLASLEKGRNNPLLDDYENHKRAMGLRMAHRKLIRWLWNNSRAYQFLDTTLDKINTQEDYERARSHMTETAPQTSVRGFPDDPASDWNSPSWELTRKLILKLKAEGARLGAPLMVMGIPAQDQLDNTPPLAVSQFNAFLDQNGIPHADAFPGMYALDDAGRGALYIGDRTHLSSAGHRFFAAATEPALERFLASPMEKR